MTIHKSKHFLLLFFTFVNLLFSQNKFENYQFRVIKEATSKRAISSITQDSYGFTWIGTNGAGLYRYDGVNYVGYEYSPQKKGTVNSNLIYATYVDRSNNLWIGTDEGLSLYNRNLDTFTKIQIGDVVAKGYSEPLTVKSIIQDNKGNLLLGTFGYGLIQLDLKTLKVKLIESKFIKGVNFQINGFAKNKKGIVFLGTNYGIFYLDSHNQVFPVCKDRFRKTPITTSIESITIDKNDFIWAGTTSEGLFKIKIDNDSYLFQNFPVTQKKVLSIISSKRDAIVCGTENDGLITLDNSGTVIKRYLHSKYDNYSLKSNSVWALYEDKDKRVWIGYYNKGLGIFDKPNNKFKAVESLLNNDNSLQTSSVTSVVKDKSGKVLISTEGGGLDVFNPVDKSIVHINKNNQSYYAGLTANDIQTIFIDSKQNVWLGSWNQGIFVLKYGTKNFVNYNTTNTKGLKSNRIFSFSEDSMGRIWIGSFVSGLHYYDATTNKFVHCNFNSLFKNDESLAYVRKVFVDSDDVLWLGTIMGLYQVNINAGNAFKVISLKNQMIRNFKRHNSIQTILSIYESNDKTIWIGTDGGGLFSYDKKKKQFYSYNEFPNFKEKSIRAIVSDANDCLWVSGGSGLSKLDLKNKSCVNFTVDDGLLVNEFNNNAVFKDGYGTLYFGSYEGMNYFDPNQIKKTEKEPSLYFSDFKLFNKSMIPGEESSPLQKVILETKSITLDHSQSVFTIEFVGINYNFPSKNEYAYYLEGFEKEWNYVGNSRTATYTNLEAGNYVFKVKAASKTGSWNQEPLELHIRVLPPWWRTYFAYVVYIGLVVFLILYLNKIYQNRFKAKQAIVLEREKAIQLEKLNNKKLQFFTNISHEFRTPLTLIINPLEDVLKNKNKDLSKETFNKLKTIHKSSDRLSRLINELMDFNKLQFNKISLQVKKIEVVDFTQEIISYFDEEAKSRNITINFESSFQKITDWLDPKMLEKIIFNIISNAFKFTPDSGTINISIVKKEEALKIEGAFVSSFSIIVADTGSGIDKKDIKKIFDRFYQVNNLNKVYYGSTGIGLEVVKEFVELHKGKIEVDSKVNEGTKFTVTFPIGKSYYDKAEVTNESFVLSSLKNNKFEEPEDTDVDTVEEPEIDKVYTVLIVEDNSGLRNYLKQELKKQYKVIVAENGKIGYELALQKLPDLIITDVIMPVMDGLELCKSIKGNLKTSHIPLLMLSAKAMVKDRLEGIDSGADIYLSKPFDLDILKSSLAQLISSRQIMFNKFYTGIANQGKGKTTTLDNEFIQKTLSFINENISDSQLSVELLSSKVFLSRSQLYRKIKTLTGVSVNEFIRNVRLEQARKLIEEGNSNINEICFKVGFTSSSYFAKCYRNKYGHLPTQGMDHKE
ncbi:two-component regulator propeller domain-containing protein [Flavobacterium faecale]|uniref:hybrid sensor histidine kinase/response regulator transcription factor n=1 Tax=Flavobacterium faecale TaxID=1355330 RepID=UPI003AAC160B